MTTPTPKEIRARLENAAKACGMIPKGFIGNANFMDGVLMRWQPHLPGLDSQLLAAELGISTDWGVDTVFCDTFEITCVTEQYTDHPSKAHAQAMAVLRAAAAIGEAML